MPMILAGNKCDLEAERQVTTSQADGLAKSMGCGFFETSAKERINVEQTFYDLVRAIRTHRQATDSPKHKKAKKKSPCRLL